MSNWKETVVELIRRKEKLVYKFDSMNGKWILCDDLLPSPSHKGLHGFVLCYTEGRVEWGRYTSYGWHGIEGTAMEVSAWYDANYTGLIKGILNVQT